MCGSITQKDEAYLSSEKVRFFWTLARKSKRDKENNLLIPTFCSVATQTPNTANGSAYEGGHRPDEFGLLVFR